MIDHTGQRLLVKKCYYLLLYWNDKIISKKINKIIYINALQNIGKQMLY